MKEITFNQQMILKYVQQYKELYRKTFNANPSNWWQFTVWLTNCTPASNFTQEDIELVKTEFSVE